MIKDLEQALSILPSGGVQYPENLNLRREDLLREIELCDNKGTLAVKLQLISKAFRLFADQMRWENENKLRMMAICERDRLQRLGRTPNGREMDTLRPTGTIPRRTGRRN